MLTNGADRLEGDKQGRGLVQEKGGVVLAEVLEEPRLIPDLFHPGVPVRIGHAPWADCAGLFLLHAPNSVPFPRTIFRDWQGRWQGMAWDGVRFVAFCGRTVSAFVFNRMRGAYLFPERPVVARKAQMR